MASSRARVSTFEAILHTLARACLPIYGRAAPARGGRAARGKIFVRGCGSLSRMIRPATEADLPVIHQLICELAEYERLRHEVDATVDDLRQTLFGPKRFAEVLMASDDA